MFTNTYCAVVDTLQSLDDTWGKRFSEADYGPADEGKTHRKSGGKGDNCGDSRTDPDKQDTHIPLALVDPSSP